MTEYNLNNIEAFKLMLDGKVVISENNLFYKLNKIYIIRSDINNFYSDYIEIYLHKFLIDASQIKFKEYIEPIKPRKFGFIAYLGENTEYLPYKDKYALHKAFSSHVSSLFNEKKDVEEIQCYKKISKFKVTMEEILE